MWSLAILTMFEKRLNDVRCYECFSRFCRDARSMDVYITKLRKHLKDDPQIEIINIHGKGYKLIAPEAEK